jgi:hypothetical protein
VVAFPSGVVRMTTANIDYHTGPRKDRPYLRHLAGPGFMASWVKHHTVIAARPRILFLQEAKTGRVRRLLADLFTGLQGKGEAESGTALFARGIKLWRRKLWLAGDSTVTLPRYVTEAVARIGGHQHLLLSAHIYPHRAGPVQQQQYVDMLAARVAKADHIGQRWIIGLDANMDLHALAEQLGGVAYGVGIVGFICHPDVEVVAQGRDTWGLRRGITDHFAYWIDVA